jgi:nucleotide-binding universal stress UspA family protein
VVDDRYDRKGRIMRSVVAAIDGTTASAGVLRVAREVARVLGGDVDAVHVVDERGPNDEQIHVFETEPTLRLLDGPVAPALVSEASRAGVEVVVMGLRRTVGGSRPVGHVALEVIERADTIIVAVPPATPSPYELRTVLVPIQGRPAEALDRVVRVAQGALLDLVILHVHDERSIPSFEDQPHYDLEAWADEFLARWVPGARHETVMEVRVGSAAEEVVRVSRECGAQMIAIGWDRELAEDRAMVVRATLERSAVPVALLPLRVRDAAATLI